MFLLVNIDSGSNIYYTAIVFESISNKLYCTIGCLSTCLLLDFSLWKPIVREKLEVLCEMIYINNINR